MGGTAWNISLFQRQIQPAYEEMLSRVTEDFRERAWRVHIAPEHADAALSDALWRRVAAIVGTSGFVNKSQRWTAAAERVSQQAAR